MAYFKYHPIFEYSLNGVTYEMVDIFRRNFINISSAFKDEFLLTNNETPERVSNIMYGDESKSWVVNLSNNIQLRSDWKLSTDLKISELIEKYKETKIYSIETLPEISTDDVLVKVSDMAGGFVPTMDPFVIVRKWDPTLRSIEVVEPNDIEFVENDLLNVLRANEITEEFDSIIQINIKRKTDYVNFPIKFSNTNGYYISPYTNPNNGVIYSAEVIGVSFQETLLYKYMNYENTSPYIIHTPAFAISSITDISIEVPSINSIGVIENQMKETLNIVDKFRNYNITIG